MSQEFWVEVSNVALKQGAGRPRISVQLKGDSDEKQWFDAPGGVAEFKPLMDAMKDKRTIHARLVGGAQKRESQRDSDLVCDHTRPRLSAERVAR